MPDMGRESLSSLARLYIFPGICESEQAQSSWIVSRPVGVGSRREAILPAKAKINQLERHEVVRDEDIRRFDIPVDQELRVEAR
jgi:hypothetical protein